MGEVEAEARGNPYRGLDRLALREILIQSKGTPEHPNLFRQAWNDSDIYVCRNASVIPLPYDENYSLQLERNLKKLYLPLPGQVDLLPKNNSQPTPDIEYTYTIHPTEKRLVFSADMENHQNFKSQSCKDCSLSDMGNGQRLIKRFGKDLKYCYQIKNWYIWNGHIWKEDDTGLINEIGKYSAVRILEEAAIAFSEKHASFAGKSLNRSRIEASIAMAQSIVPVTINQLDSDPYLFNAKNGMINLRTWEFREHRREDMQTMIAGAAYDPIAKCPVWEAHLMKIFDEDKDLISEIQEYFGYILSGENSEEILLIAHGSGSNGKSVTKETLFSVMGDYARNVAPETLMTRKDNSAPRPDLARLRGARFIAVNEGEVTSRFSEGTIKALTSPDHITARELFQKEIEFTMSGLIFFATNHKPKVFGQDYAIWRRLKLIPFLHTITDEEKDLSIKEKLKMEGSGILNWLLIGYRRYIDRGRLPKSQKIDSASRAYKQESDVLGEFLSGYIISGKDQDVIPRSELFNSYKLSLDTSEKPIQKRMFNDMTRERLGREEIQIKGKGWCWSGIHAKESKQGTLT